MKERIFISGKITNDPDFKDKFQAAEWRLKNNGYKDVINPTKLNHDHSKTWQEYMKVCIAALVTCDKVYALNDWETSTGAQEEIRLAKVLGIYVIYESVF